MLRPQRLQISSFRRASTFFAIVLTALTFSACSSVPKPKMPKMPKVPKVSMPKMPKVSMPKLPKMENMPLVGKKKPKPEAQAAGGGAVEEVKAKPSLTGGGTVEFRGFKAAALQDFRVIPEEGTELFTPQNQVYGAVDGFWWRQQRGLWFKIPNHSSVVVKAAPDPVIRSAFTTSSESGKVGFGIQKLRGKPVEPRFYPDAGATAHPTDYPFPIDSPSAGNDSAVPPVPLLPPGEEEASSFLAP